MTKAKKPYVLVTTEFRGVFAGELVKRDDEKHYVELANARNCIYWPASIGGFLGLAAKGPNSETKIGTETARLDLFGVTSVAEIGPDAEERWRSA